MPLFFKKDFKLTYSDYDVKKILFKFFNLCLHT